MEQFKINRTLMISWCLVVFMLAVTYIAEIFKGQRTVEYVLVFLAVWCIPVILCNLWYRRDANSSRLCYGIVYGYLISYAFTLMTAHSFLAYVYIFPLLSVVILYHDGNLVAQLGIATILVNIVYIIKAAFDGLVNIGNSNLVEIQVASLVTSFIGCYLASKLFDELYQKHLASMKHIQQVSLETIGVIANTVDAKDSYTEGHSRRVAAYSYALAKKLGMSEEEAQNIKTIGLLHDIGKIGIPDSVLHKPGKLTDDEYSIMKMHPTIGANILKDITILDGLAVGAHYHHERMDGKGYPEGLKGEEIPFIARIICVADCFDAMNSNRIYRSRFSMDYILKELKNNEGTQFDPKVAEAMIALIHENALQGAEEKRTSQSSDKEDVLKGSGVYLLDTIASKNAQHPNDLMSVSTADWAKSFRKYIETVLLQQDGRVFVIDVDDMNQINSQYGYAKGDLVLKTVYQTLYEDSEIKTLMHSGGDEFICWIETSADDTEYIAYLHVLMQKIQTEIEQKTECRNVHVSIGTSSSSISGRDYDKLIADSYKALYFAKKSGKNHIDVYDSGRRYSATPKTAVEHDLNTIADIISNENDYKGAYHTDYSGFEKIYNLLRNISSRYLDNVQLILFTVEFDAREENVTERDMAMNILESAIIITLRKTDVTTRYSSTQQLLLLMNINDENMKMITDRIRNEFYRMYDKGNVTLLTSSKNVSMEKLKYRTNTEKHS
ncbi:MAG: diguanylate cyclase [Solobacterium sp.]|nr:diguanylate cyclase [Solobacterium sp.]MCH4206127.1 diguanylate cyclase [Solobacterium sp.]MCH4227593.1 diguanylate cyclase [Solobacterium sp.]MCH4282607.1 diguanylate cyclase [Solobacterium sp.]